MINEVIFFNYGDSNDASNWSNVPYCFTKALEKLGIEIHRVNISPSINQWKWYNRFQKHILKKFFPRVSWGYMQSPIFAIITYWKILTSVIKYRKSDLCIFTNFDFYNCFSHIPTLLFCDWTYKILIEDRQNRQALFTEIPFLLQQKIAIEHSDYVLSLFPRCAKKMKNDYPQANIKYLGTNVINNLYEGVPEKSLITSKKERLKILFIGRHHYKEAAIKLIEAFEYVCEKYKDAELNIIGLNSSDIPLEESKNINFYGFLHKEDVEERELYYNLLKHSTLICNSSEKWAGYSSMVEAMYFYTPVIVSPYEDFKCEFGNTIEFGAYISENTVQQLSKLIIELYESPKYDDMCVNANHVVKTYTWDNYINKIINTIEK